MPDGQSKQGLIVAATTMLAEDFAGRRLPFDETTAIYYATISATRTRLGRPNSVEDAQIAAIAVIHGLILATCNERDFELIDELMAVNPWQAEAPGDSVRR